MPWKENKKLIKRGYRDLKYVPPGRAEWDATLSCLAYQARIVVERGPPDLGAWAARHGLPTSKRLQALGGKALVLWHGTSRQRAERIAEHGLFHKKGLWTAVEPTVPHSFCRMRSERFGTEGAVICLLLDPDQWVEGRNFEINGESKSTVYRFHHGLPPEVVEYVMVREEIRFLGGDRASRPKPCPGRSSRGARGPGCPRRRPPCATRPRTATRP